MVSVVSLKLLVILLVCVAFTRSAGYYGRNNYTPYPSYNKSSTAAALKIIGGVETQRYEFPFIVSLARQNRHFCGGSIIDTEWVLTAAHCASEPDFAVTAGEHDLNKNEGTEQQSRSMKVIRHPNYNPITYEDDICLVKVSPPFAYTDYVKPFAIPSTHYIAHGNATVAGWGTEDEAYQVVSPVLRKVTVPLVQSIDCASQYGGYFHPHKMICAGLEEGGKDACQGDSGGPLMCSDYQKGATLCGVVSFGLGCARPELAGVYTKVAHYRDWIEYEIKKNTDPKSIRRTTTNKYQNTITLKTAPPYNPAADRKYQTIPPGHEVIIIRPVKNDSSLNHHHNYDRKRNSGNLLLSNHISIYLWVLIAYRFL